MDIQQEELSKFEPEFGAAPAPVSSLVGQVEEFDRLVLEVERTAREWGVRPESLEGRFVSALLGCTRWAGRLNEAAQAEFSQLFEHHEKAIEMDLARAREITRAAQIALNQARNAQIALQVEQENVLVRMVKETLPLFIQRMKEVLVVREQRLNDGSRGRRYAVVAIVTLGVFLGGYALCAWQDWGAAGAIARCVAHPVTANGHLYCELKLLGG